MQVKMLRCCHQLRGKREEGRNERQADRVEAAAAGQHLGDCKYLDGRTSANISPCVAPRPIVGGFSSSAALSTSAIPRMAQETIRLSGISTISKCSTSELTKGAT